MKDCVNPPPTNSYRSSADRRPRCPGDGRATAFAETSESTRREAASIHAAGKHEAMGAVAVSSAGAALLPNSQLGLRHAQRRAPRTRAESPISLRLNEAEGMGSAAPDANPLFLLLANLAGVASASFDIY